MPPATPPTAGKTNLSLGNLRRAVTGATSGPFSLAADGRGSNTITSMLDFAVAAIPTPTGETNPLIFDPTYYYMVFSSPGGLFVSKIATRTANQAWSSVSGKFDIDADNGDDIRVDFNDLGAETVRCVWADFFNIAASNYGVNRDLSISISV